jgi:hypothetical protein
MVVCAVPSAALVFVLAALAQPSLWAAAALAGLVATGAWLAALRRHATDIPRPVERPARS